MNLASALELFNRKERNLLFRRALGHKESRLRLSDTFRTEVQKELAIEHEIPADAWWATDFHFDWLAGALKVHAQGKDEASKQQENLSFEERHLVEGNQEDIDLVIATDGHLIMIEAKAYSAWSNSQMASKIERINLLHQYYATLPHASEPPIEFHFLLISPNEPKKLVAKWPSWIHRSGGKIPWIQLPVEDTVLGVTCCDQNGSGNNATSRWRVISIKHA
jgi:hypothetical protein